MRFLGVDPDLHTTGIAEVSDTGQLLRVSVARVGKEYKGRAAAEEMTRVVFGALGEISSQCDMDHIHAAVESQEIVSTSRRGANPCDLLDLAYVTGAAAAALYFHRVWMPKPQKWKGSVPKKIHQARTFIKAGGATYEMKGGKDPYVVPLTWITPAPRCEGLKKSDWKHVMDAIGLAYWAKEEYERIDAFVKRQVSKWVTTPSV